MLSSEQYQCLSVLTDNSSSLCSSRGVKTLCSKPVQLCDVCSLQPPLLHNIVRGSYPRSLSPPDRHLLVALVSRPGRSKQLQTVREWAGPAVPGCLALGSKLKHWRLETMAVIPDTATQPLWLGQSPSCLSITISMWLDTHLIGISTGGKTAASSSLCKKLPYLLH